MIKTETHSPITITTIRIGEFWQASLTDWNNNLNSIVRFTAFDRNFPGSAQDLFECPNQE